MRSSHLLLFFLVAFASQPLDAAPEAESIIVRLRKLRNAARVLMVGSHPDDEDSSLLARLALKDGARVWYLSLTRGEGGQNRIGDEKGVALGLVRTGELLAARRIDGAEQLLGPFIDFGYSKTHDETFERWGRRRMVACIVQAIRQTRCDLVVSIWRGEPSDGHGHHVATGLVTVEAYNLAADADAFPDLGAPWKSRRLIARYRPGRDEIGGASQWAAHDIDMEVGRWDPVLGRSPHEVAMEGRSLHRSQDMGALQDKGRRRVAYSFFQADRPDFDPPLFFVLSGLAVRLHAWVQDRCGEHAPAGSIDKLREYVELMQHVEIRYRPQSPSLREIVQGIKLLRKERRRWRSMDASCVDAVVDRLDEKLEQLQSLWIDAAGVTLEALSDVPDISPGELLRVELQMARRGGEHAQLFSMESAGCARVETVLSEVPEGRWPLSGDLQPAGVLDVHIPENGATAVGDAALPWTWRAPAPGYYHFNDPIPDLRPRASLAASVRCTIETVNFLPITFERPVEYRRVDPGLGELRSPLRVLPPLTLDASPSLHVVRRGTKVKPVTTFTVQSHRAGLKITDLVLFGDGDDRLSIELDAAALDAEGANVAVRQVLDVDLDRAGTWHWNARWVDSENRRRPARALREIRYPHIEEMDLLEPVEVRVVVVDCQVPDGLRVGYVAGTGDGVPLALKSLGVEVEVLDMESIAFGDLTRFDSVVVGIRALEVREELLPHRQRLWDYARQGGTLVVQYHKPREDGASRFVPFEGAFMKRPAPRVTDESAVVTILQTDDPLMNVPNKIVASDFDGWVQERGLYFLEKWPKELVPILGCRDADEPQRLGGLLHGELGKGHYVYCAYSLFRQLPAGVPGAYRLLANMVSL